MNPGRNVGTDSAGDFVVVWQSGPEGTGSVPQDGSGYGIFAQRDNASGAAMGSEFQVNTYTTGNQVDPVVAMDAAGDFVIAWSSQYEDGGSGGSTGGDYGVFAQRYSASGAAMGSEFQVNTYTTGTQRAPSIGMDSAGDFVIAWQSLYQDGSDYGVYAQRYNASGTAQGSEFRVNTYTTGAQFTSSVAVDSAGDFVITWDGYLENGSGYAIYAQRYSATGAAQGSEFQVNTYSLGQQPDRQPFHSSVAMDSGGDFVVAWQNYGEDGSGYGIYAQRYNAAGAAQGSEFSVNTYTTGAQFLPSVAMDSGGDFAVTWEGYYEDGSSYGIFAQRYSSSARPRGANSRSTRIRQASNKSPRSEWMRPEIS